MAQKMYSVSMAPSTPEKRRFSSRVAWRMMRTATSVQSDGSGKLARTTRSISRCASSERRSTEGIGRGVGSAMTGGSLARRGLTMRLLPLAMDELEGGWGRGNGGNGGRVLLLLPFLPWSPRPPPPPDHHYHQQRRLREPGAHPPRLPLRPPRPVSSERAPDAAGENTYEEEGEDLAAAGVREVEEDRDERYGFEMEVRKLQGKKNRRLVRARVRVGAPLEAVWATLTDYEGLAGFIPGLSECRLLHQDAAFARLDQVGEQDLALGFKFNAKGTIDCYEGEMELLSESRARRREIAFNMVDGDFKVFVGK